MGTVKGDDFVSALDELFHEYYETEPRIVVRAEFAALAHAGNVRETNAGHECGECWSQARPLNSCRSRSKRLNRSDCRWNGRPSLWRRREHARRLAFVMVVGAVPLPAGGAGPIPTRL
jgi:hypothetical protein